ncbi:MAG: WecB/TagA/CpsF family glycosyltransferase [Thermodesulfobacteriota bacterium]|nr:WecB/TagA/CpsF family glycosyltransferase [Thermodesulfobacteriota bacterium]
MIKRYPILDVWVDAVDMEGALKRAVEFVETGDRPHTIFACNPEKNFSVPKDPLLYKTFQNADLLIPDGIGVVLAARILHGARLRRVPGCELMQNLCGLAAEKKYEIFIYGAKEEVNKAAADRLGERFPDIRIAGRSHGYVPEEGMEALVGRINESKARILFLALGSPKQEQWISKYLDRLKHVRVCQGIGGTLDVLAGTVKRAPDIYCRFGLEWLYRLLSEPKRLARQKVLPVFAAQVMRERLRKLLSSSG